MAVVSNSIACSDMIFISRRIFLGEYAWCFIRSSLITSTQVVSPFEFLFKSCGESRYEWNDVDKQIKFFSLSLCFYRKKHSSIISLTTSVRTSSMSTEKQVYRPTPPPIYNITSPNGTENEVYLDQGGQGRYRVTERQPERSACGRIFRLIRSNC